MALPSEQHDVEQVAKKGMKMIKRIDHIGIAVKDTAEALKFYAEALGISPAYEEVVESQGVKVTFLPVGETTLEILESIDPTSATAKSIETRGEGIHHICLEVDDISTSLKSLEDKGVTLIDNEPRLGAHDKRVAFVHPKSTNGVLLELAELSEH